jgi:hypothetical protein
LDDCFLSSSIIIIIIIIIITIVVIIEITKSPCLVVPVVVEEMMGTAILKVKAKEVDDGGLDLAQDLVVGVENRNSNSNSNRFNSNSNSSTDHTMVLPRRGTHLPPVCLVKPTSSHTLPPLLGSQNQASQETFRVYSGPPSNAEAVVTVNANANVNIRVHQKIFNNTTNIDNNNNSNIMGRRLRRIPRHWGP